MERVNTHLESQTEQTSIWERRALISGILFVLIAIVGTLYAMVFMLYLGRTVASMTVSLAEEGGDAATVSAFDALAPMSLALSAFPRAILLGAVSLLVLQHGLTARWIGIAGFVLAAIHLLGTSTLVEGGFFPIVALGSLLFTLWTLALSVSLLRRTAPVAQPAPQAVPA